MKQFLQWFSLLLVLLMIVPLAVACNDTNKDDPEQTETETEKQTEAPTEPELTPEEIEQKKAEMSDAILEALGKSETSTEQQTKPEEETTAYAGVVEELLGSLGGLGNGDYDYGDVIADVLDAYIGTNSTSEFIRELIKGWIEDRIEQNQNSTTEIEIDTSVPDKKQSLEEFIADKTADAVADALVERMNALMGGMMLDAVHDAFYDSIYESVYNAMIGDEGYMDGIIEEVIPGYGQLNGLLGGFGQ